MYKAQTPEEYVEAYTTAAQELALASLQSLMSDILNSEEYCHIPDRIALISDMCVTLLELSDTLARPKNKTKGTEKHAAELAKERQQEAELNYIKALSPITENICAEHNKSCQVQGPTEDYRTQLVDILQHMQDIKQGI